MFCAYCVELAAHIVVGAHRCTSVVKWLVLIALLQGMTILLGDCILVLLSSRRLCYKVLSRAVNNSERLVRRINSILLLPALVVYSRIEWRLILQ